VSVRQVIERKEVRERERLNFNPTNQWLVDYWSTCFFLYHYACVNQQLAGDQDENLSKTKEENFEGYFETACIHAGE